MRYLLFEWKLFTTQEVIFLCHHSRTRSIQLFHRCLTACLFADVQEFILDAKMIQVRYTDSSSLKQLVSGQGYGRVRSIQREKLRGLTFTYPYKFQHQRCGTKEAFGCVDGRSRYVTLHVEGHEPAGEVEREELRMHGSNSRNMSKIVKTILRLTALMGLDSYRCKPRGVL